MTYNVFGGTLNLAQSLCTNTSPNECVGRAGIAHSDERAARWTSKPGRAGTSQ